MYKHECIYSSNSLQCKCSSYKMVVLFQDRPEWELWDRHGLLSEEQARQAVRGTSVWEWLRGGGRGVWLWTARGNQVEASHLLQGFLSTDNGKPSILNEWNLVRFVNCLSTEICGLFRSIEGKFSETVSNKPIKSFILLIPLEKNYNEMTFLMPSFLLYFIPGYLQEHRCQLQNSFYPMM